MQLDRTRIAIRERDLLDALDFTLVLIRKFAGGLLAPLAMGILPFVALNWALIDWMVPFAIEDAREQMAMTPGDQWDTGESLVAAFNPGAWRYYWAMFALVFMQGPAATGLAVAWLGGAVFRNDRSARELWRDLLKSFPAVFVTQWILRGTLFASLLPLLYATQFEWSFGWELMLMALLMAIAALLRALRPYVNEIALLERNPLIARNESTMTIGRRSAFLHGPSGGDLFFRWIVSTFVAVAMFLAILLSIHGVGYYVFDSYWWIDGFGFRVVYPLALWSVVIFMFVFRFLSYLDLRIRYEGWEVELLMRAEAERAFRKVA